jgi:hypothetical protein
MQRFILSLTIAAGLVLTSQAQAANKSSGGSHGHGSLHPGKHVNVKQTSHHRDRDRHVGGSFHCRQQGWSRCWHSGYRCRCWWCPRTHCYYRWWAARGCYCPIEECPPDLDDDDGPEAS